MINFRRSYVVNNKNNKSKLFEALPVPGDGNCFYHSVSYFLGIPHHKIKKQCLAKLKTEINTQKTHRSNGFQTLHGSKSCRSSCDFADEMYRVKQKDSTS